MSDEVRVLTGRVMALERAVVLLANHVGAVGWNYELINALDALRYPPAPGVEAAGAEQQPA